MQKKKKISYGTKTTLVGMSFILPNFIGFLLFVLIPILFSFVLSVMKWDGANPMQFVGLANFKAIFGDKQFVQALIRTGIYTFFCVVLTMFAALFLAVLLNNKFKGRGFFRSAIFFPYVASVVSVAVVWKLLFMKDMGPINNFLRGIGISDPPGWFSSTKWALPAVIIVSIWRFMGYYMVVYLAGLQDIPEELGEAAKVDGASNMQYFWKIVMPNLRNTHFFVIMMLTINSFKSFDLVYALTEGKPGTSTKMLAQYIYDKAFVSFDYGQTSAAAMVLFVVVAIITVIQLRVEKKME